MWLHGLPPATSYLLSVQTVAYWGQKRLKSPRAQLVFTTIPHAGNESKQLSCGARWFDFTVKMPSIFLQCKKSKIAQRGGVMCKRHPGASNCQQESIFPKTSEAFISVKYKCAFFVVGLECVRVHGSTTASHSCSSFSVIISRCKCLCICITWFTINPSHLYQQFGWLPSSLQWILESFCHVEINIANIRGAK